MNCPVCRKEMIVVEYASVELDHCLECRGVWFDRDELEQLLGSINLRVEDMHLKAAADSIIASRGEKPRRCPLCRKNMKKISVGENDPVVLDRCERHGGYWFDGGELTKVIRKNLPEGEWKHVGGFIGDIFGDEMKKEES